MSDPLRNLRAFAENMTPQERHFLANADFLKLRRFLDMLTPETLEATRALFNQGPFLSSPAPIRSMCDGIATTAFLPEQIEGYEKVLEAIKSAGWDEKFGFPAPEAA